MKALVKSHAKKGIWLEDVPMPEVGNNDVLVKVQKTAICGTDKIGRASCRERV